jgi:hypothetical protein
VLPSGVGSSSPLIRATSTRSGWTWLSSRSEPSAHERASGADRCGARARGAQAGPATVPGRPVIGYKPLEEAACASSPCR